jgi:hypothetical protein
MEVSVFENDDHPNPEPAAVVVNEQHRRSMP